MGERSPVLYPTNEGMSTNLNSMRGPSLARGKGLKATVPCEPLKGQNCQLNRAVLKPNSAHTRALDVVAAPVKGPSS